MNLTLTLALIAKQLAAPAVPHTDMVVVEIVGEGENGRAALHLDAYAEELVVEASPRTWQRLQRLLETEPESTDSMVMIHLPGRSLRASTLAPMLAASVARLDVQADPRTNSIFVSAASA